MASGASFQQNEQGWAVASSRKGRNSGQGANRSRGGASSNAYAPERSWVGAGKGKPGFNAEGQRGGRWPGNPNGEPLGWREAGETPQRNGHFENNRAHAGANGTAGGSSVAQVGPTRPNSEAWGPPASTANAWMARSGAAVVTATAVPPPLTGVWQFGKIINPASSSAVGKGKGSEGANGGASGEKVDMTGKLMPTLLPFEQSGERPQSEVGYQSSDVEEEIDELDSDDVMSSDDYDSAGSDVSHETMKKNRWFKTFFGSLDSLTTDQMNEPERQWHCPACRGGVGSIDWYRGMLPLLAHAKTMRSRRVKLHRKLADVLEEELRRRGAGCVIAEEMFGQWKGLQESVVNQQIVWPPIVIIQNTLLEQDENEQWIGMGNKELLEYFKGYKAMRARHAYGPKGHRGMSVLIFEESAVGYMEAERVHKHFFKERKGKEDWERPGKVMFHPGGKRVLYGYLATEEEMEIFNRHSKGKSRLKYEMRSYQQAVVESMKQMSEDNQKLTYYKNKAAEHKQNSKTLEETVSLVSTKLRMRESEIKIIRDRATEQHEESKKEMDYLEQSYRQQIGHLNEDVVKREQDLERMQNEFKISHLNRCHELEVNSAKLPKDKAVVNEEQMKIKDEIAKHTIIVETSFKDSEEYERERQELIKVHDRKRREIKLRHLQEEIAFEKELEQERIKLLEKYAKKREEANCLSA